MAPQKVPRKNPKRGRGAFVLELAGHSVMGTAMGLGFCLLLLITGRQNLANLIAHNPEPKITAMLLMGFVSLVFAAGATLTGMVLMTIEES